MLGAHVYLILSILVDVEDELFLLHVIIDAFIKSVKRIGSARSAATCTQMEAVIFVANIGFSYGHSGNSLR